MGIFKKFNLKGYNEDYYKIYEKLEKIDFDEIPSFRKMKDFLNIKENEKILDAGCGDGHLLNYFVKGIKCKAYGVDISDVALKIAKKRYPDIKFYKQNLVKLKFPSQYFDKIVCYNVIEHIAEQDKVLKELKRVLKKNGILVIGTNIKNSICWKLYQLLITEHTHIKEFTVKEFVEFVGKYFFIEDKLISSGVFRVPKFARWIFHYILKSDIILKARRT